ncbi:MAG: hypothetical protein BGO96_13990 [Micrococcales bacterium 73-15]|uniref:CBS domain-containing protein n=1 Tax=Salana multivorans TaxID=120377 RepID=UPI00095C7B3D|nr:CBS domain-containing protein [Salana multivorans]OJX97992.1 MAG: hypothetical protein BGO96_13990 [Micrococcales bacterium 73-15]
MTRVRDLMSPDIHVVAETDPLTATARLMRAHDVGSLPVCGQDGRLRGVLTDRDIVVGAVADDANPALTTVGSLATASVVTVEVDADLDEARRLMAGHRVRRLPVLEDGRLVGVLSQADLARHDDAAHVGVVVGEISEP